MSAVSMQAIQTASTNIEKVSGQHAKAIQAASDD